MLGITYDYEGHQFQWDVSILELFDFKTFYPQDVYNQTVAVSLYFSQNFGSLKWELVGCLALTWLLVIASLWKGLNEDINI